MAGRTDAVCPVYVRAVTADAAGDLGIEPGSADLVVASCVANNMLNEIAGHCPNGDADTVGYARWYHAWDTRPLPLLEQARRLLTAEAPAAVLIG